MVFFTLPKSAVANEMTARLSTPDRVTAKTEPRRRNNLAAIIGEED